MKVTRVPTSYFHYINIFYIINIFYFNLFRMFENWSIGKKSRAETAWVPAQLFLSVKVDAYILAGLHHSGS